MAQAVDVEEGAVPYQLLLQSMHEVGVTHLLGHRGTWGHVIPSFATLDTVPPCTQRGGDVGVFVCVGVGGSGCLCVCVGRGGESHSTWRLLTKSLSLMR